MPEYSEECLSILKLLRDRHNVLISGSPGTGKSRLLQEVGRAFISSSTGPVHVPGKKVAIPKTPPPVAVLSGVLPSVDRTDRKVFKTVFHQNSKYRDFVSGLVPVVGSAASGGETKFRVMKGTLLRASDHAKTTSGASLLIIDEINRGPAVQIFGGSIVAIESDKRLRSDGLDQSDTQYFELLKPEDGELVEYALPHHLYILAAMNQADTSVEPLDVAFLRRWAPFKLDPDETILLKHFGIKGISPSALPETPGKREDVFAAAILAWRAVNNRISLGRGPEFQIGHGVLMVGSRPLPTDVPTSLNWIAEVWRTIRAHVDEVFFGDVRGVAAVLNVGDDKVKHVYTLEDRTFANDPRIELVGPDPIKESQIYPLLRAVAGA